VPRSKVFPNPWLPGPEKYTRSLEIEPHRYSFARGDVRCSNSVNGGTFRERLYNPISQDLGEGGEII
jgi:hypothetical protein